MNSSIVNILEVLKNAKALNALGYSSYYTFDKLSASEYFEELIQSAHSTEPIFSGIVILEKSANNFDFAIIDGLQRIITISLLLAAICEAYKGISKTNDEARHKISTRYLLNNVDIKLHLNGADGEAYHKIITGEELSKEDAESNLYSTYQIFLNNLIEKKISATKLFNVISRMQFMAVVAEGSKTPVREIYQSINKDKDDLTQINLITSFVDQNCGGAIGTWNSIFEAYEKFDSYLIKKFVRDFLTIQNNGKIPRENRLYVNFKNYFTQISEYQNPEQVLDNLKKYSDFYLKIVRAEFDDYEVKKLITTLNENNGQDSYPYLMEVLEDLENNHITREIFLEILNMINLFVSQRNIDNPDDTSLSFARLSGELNKMLAIENYQPEISNENKLTINEINHLSTFEV